MSNMAKAVAGQSRQEWDPTRLYAAGEAGALLLFDQPVRGGRGAVLDTAGGGAEVGDSVVGVAAIEPGSLGPDLVANGDFANGTTGWSVQSGSVSTFSVTDGVLRLRGFNSSLRIVNDTPLSLAAGQLFLLWFDFPESGNGANVYVQIAEDAAGTGLTTLFTTTTTGEYGPLLCRAPSDSPYIYLQVSGATGDYIDADNVRVQAIPGAGAFQGSASLQPTRGRGPAGTELKQLFYSTEDLSNETHWVRGGGATPNGAGPLTPSGRSRTTQFVPDGVTVADVIDHIPSYGWAPSVMSIVFEAVGVSIIKIGGSTTNKRTRTHWNIPALTVNFQENGNATILDFGIESLGGNWYRAWHAASGFGMQPYIGWEWTDPADASSFINIGEPQFEFATERTDYVARGAGTGSPDYFVQGQQSHGFIRLDHVDDKLTLTFPDGLTGADVYIAGRNGSWLESGIDVTAGGTLDLGPKNSVGGFTQAVQALGDLVGMVVIERALTATEKALLADYFRGRGAKGLLIEQLDSLLVNGGFDTDLTGWTVTSGWTWQAGAARGVLSSTGQTITQTLEAPTATPTLARIDHRRDRGALRFRYTQEGGIDLSLDLDYDGVPDEIMLGPDVNSVYFQRDANGTMYVDGAELIPYAPEEEAEPRPDLIAGDAGVAFLFDAAERRAAPRVLGSTVAPVADGEPVVVATAPVGFYLAAEELANPGGPFVDMTGFSRNAATSTQVSETVIDGVATFETSGAGYARYQQLIGDVAAGLYVLRADATDLQEFQIKGTGDPFPPASHTTSEPAGFVDIASAQTGRAFHFRTPNGTDTVGQMRSMSLRRIDGLHFYQASASLRPTYSVDVNGHGALAFDLVDDKMSATFPSGFSGDVFFAGRNGCWIERDVTVSAGGTLDIGVKNGPNTLGLLFGLGALVGVVCVDHTITDTERTNLRDFFMARGAKGMLVGDGTEIIVNGTFDSDTDWNTATGWTIAGGQADCANDGSGRAITQNLTGLTLDAIYIGSVEVIETVGRTGYITPQFRAGAGPEEYGDIQASDVGQQTFILKNTISVNPNLEFNARANSVLAIDNVSLQRLVAEEDL